MLPARRRWREPLQNRPTNGSGQVLPADAALAFGRVPGNLLEKVFGGCGLSPRLPGLLEPRARTPARPPLPSHPIPALSPRRDRLSSLGPGTSLLLQVKAPLLNADERDRAPEKPSRRLPERLAGAAPQGRGRGRRRGPQPLKEMQHHRTGSTSCLHGDGRPRAPRDQLPALVQRHSRLTDPHGATAATLRARAPERSRARISAQQPQVKKGAPHHDTHKPRR